MRYFPRSRERGVFGGEGGTGVEEGEDGKGVEVECEGLGGLCGTGVGEVGVGGEEVGPGEGGERWE